MDRHPLHTPTTPPAPDPNEGLRFYLGTANPRWLETLSVPLFISRNRLKNRKRLPRARVNWALDSGGFTALRDHGGWRISAEEYADEVRRYADGITRMDWAAPMDWMCEPWMIDGGDHGGQRYHGTGLTVLEHQHLTVDNFVQLRSLAPDLPFIPVLQGWDVASYERCIDLYARVGIDLRAEPLVGLGSVCRRQATEEIGQIVTTLAKCGLRRLHGFGVKQAGIARYGDYLASADSMAWSYGARRKGQRRPGCTHRARTCSSCPAYALAWRERVLRDRQLSLFD